MTASLTGPVPVRARQIASPRAAHARRRKSRSGARRSTTSRTSTSTFPLGVLTLRHRRLRLGQVLAGQRDPVQRPGRPAAPRKLRSGAHRRSTGWSSSTRSSPSTRRPSAARRAPTRPPTSASTTTSGSSLAHARGAHPRLQAGALLLQRQGRALRGLPGDGLIKIEMQFLPDVYVPCEVCSGKRFNRETLEIRFKGQTIADVLEMTVEEALRVLRERPAIARRCRRCTTWAWATCGWASRRRRSPAARRSGSSWPPSCPSGHRRTLYILDEPTTGLHFADVQQLLDVLGRLVDHGNTVVVIEHNLDVIKTADWIVDLGPEGGAAAGGWWRPALRRRWRRSPGRSPASTWPASSSRRSRAGPGGGRRPRLEPGPGPGDVFPPHLAG